MGLGMALLLAGCAAPMPGHAPAPAPDIPSIWAQAGRSAVATPASPLAAWWRRFNDPLLPALVEQALQANTSVLGAQAALRQARALREAAAAGLQPTLGSSASAQRGTSGGHSTGSVFQVGLDAGWELDVFGGRRSALATAEATERASAASLGDVQVSVAAEVALSYIALRGTQAQWAIARDNLTSQLQTLQITEWRVQAGLLSTLEAAQARAAAAQTQALLPALQSSLQQNAHALAVLTGQPPAALLTLAATAAALPLPAGELALSLPAETLRQRPDVRAAEQQVLAAQGRVAQADAARYPSFSLGGSLGLNALSLGALGESAAVVGSLLARVTLPLWDGGAARAQVRAQQAALEQSQASYRAAVLLALREVEDALVALGNDRQRATRLQEAAGAATEAAALARQRFSGGLVDFQTVLETQRTQFGTQDGLAGLHATLGADHVRLYKALGGGWASDAAPVPPSTPPARSPR